MSSCLYKLELDIIKSPSTSTLTTHYSSSPSSTISETSNSPLVIATRKPRTQRKRPNQTYNEAAALLSTAYPNIFTSDDSSKPCKFSKPNEYSSFSFEESSSELLLPAFPDEKHFDFKQCTSSIHTDETNGFTNSSNLCDGFEDFDTDSILDEEIEDGVIDSIMGNVSVCLHEENKNNVCNDVNVGGSVNFCYGYPVSLGLWLGGRFDFTFDMMRGGTGNVIRQNDEDWWSFPTVNVGDISPRCNNHFSSSTQEITVATKENSVLSKSVLTSSKENSVQDAKFSGGLLLKLDYNEVLTSWSDRGSPFSDDIAGSEFSGSDALEKLAQIDLFGETGALREASVQRYKEKRRTRLFSKKIRYQVRKVNADQRPRMKVKKSTHRSLHRMRGGRT